MKPPTRVGLVAHRDRERARSLACQAADFLVGRGLDVRMLEDDADKLGRPELAHSRDAFLDGLDVAIAFGGDGTMLHTAGLAFGAGAAVLGVNVGRLGYLTEIEPDDLEWALLRVTEGDYDVEQRMALDIQVTSNGPAGGTWVALNEVVLERVAAGHMVRLAVKVNGTFFTSYAADGVIVATPTGSTAYSFSVRGPIISPRMRCQLLTPVSPYMLFDRALVFGEQEHLEFRVLDGRRVVLTVDGRELGVLDPGDVVTCPGHPQAARMLTFGRHDFHQVLKAKFGLADR